MADRGSSMRLYLSLASHFLSGAVVVPIAALLAFSVGASLEGTCSGRPPAAEIFVGITYGCKQLEPSEEARGVVHWARIDLTASGITPFVTSKDPTAVSQGWQYRLRRVADSWQENILRSPSMEPCSVLNPVDRSRCPAT